MFCIFNLWFSLFWTVIQFIVISFGYRLLQFHTPKWVGVVLFVALYAYNFLTYKPRQRYPSDLNPWG